MSIEKRAAKHLARPSDADDIQVVRSEGALLFAADRKRYIDFTSGWNVGNLGWGVEEIADAIRRFDGPDYVAPDFLYEPWVELAELLASIAPGRLTKSFRATGGTEAVEIALQAAMASTGRGKFVGIEGSYHGNSIGAMSVAASENREKFAKLLPGCRKISPPLDARAVDKVERALRSRDVAAFIMEPVILNLGALVPDPGFMSELQRLCRKYGTVLVLDEVACGFGRTGRLFASEHFDLEPDILCLGKALSGGYAAIGATMITDRLARSLDDFEVYSTYGWHPRSVAAAIASVRHLVRNQEKLLENVAAMSDYFRMRLSQLEYEFPSRVQGKGLALGVNVENEDYAERLVEKCREAGLIIGAQGETITMFPPLTLDRDTAEAGLDIFEECVTGRRRSTRKPAQGQRRERARARGTRERV
jgi:4-aminobutyrate aminotransferase-like enzyme